MVVVIGVENDWYFYFVECVCYVEGLIVDFVCVVFVVVGLLVCFEVLFYVCCMVEMCWGNLVVCFNMMCILLIEYDYLWFVWLMFEECFFIYVCVDDLIVGSGFKVRDFEG